METSNQTITRKTQVQMGGWHHTGHLPNEDRKLDSLRPGSREVQKGHWEGQNFQLGSSAPGRRRIDVSNVTCVTEWMNK